MAFLLLMVMSREILISRSRWSACAGRTTVCNNVSACDLTACEHRGFEHSAFERSGGGRRASRSTYAYPSLPLLRSLSSSLPLFFAASLLRSPSSSLPLFFAPSRLRSHPSPLRAPSPAHFPSLSSSPCPLSPTFPPTRPPCLRALASPYQSVDSRPESPKHLDHRRRRRVRVHRRRACATASARRASTSPLRILRVVGLNRRAPFTRIQRRRRRRRHGRRRSTSARQRRRIELHRAKQATRQSHGRPSTKFALNTETTIYLNALKIRRVAVPLGSGSPTLESPGFVLERSPPFALFTAPLDAPLALLHRSLFKSRN